MHGSFGGVTVGSVRRGRLAMKRTRPITRRQRFISEEPLPRCARTWRVFVRPCAPTRATTRGSTTHVDSTCRRDMSNGALIEHLVREGEEIRARDLLRSGGVRTYRSVNRKAIR